MRLVPYFTLETNNQTNNECLPEFVQTDYASSSIKTAIEKQGNSTYVVIQEVEVLPLKLSQVLFIIQSHFKSDKSFEMEE